MKVNILGTEYTVTESTEAEDENLQGVDGYCDTSIKSIVIDKMDKVEPHMKKDLASHKRVVLRHELTHAYLYESGLAECSWAQNEEMVDWIALQIPKMVNTFNEVNAF